MNTDTLIILSPGFPADENDSTCLPAQQQIVLALNKNFPSLKIIIVAFQYPFSTIPYTWHGNKVIPLGGENKKRLQRLLVWKKAWSVLQKLPKNSLMGVCCFWYGECALVGKRFAKKNKLPFFTWLLGQDAREGNKYVKWLRLPADELVAISPSVVAEFDRNYFVQPAHIIPNAVTPSLFPVYSGEKTIDIIGVGSLIALKRYDIFIDVIGEIKKKIPTVSAVICGKGPEQKAIEILIAEKGLSDNITLAGELPYNEVLALMQQSKLLLHPSSYEGFSGVCLEALYAGAHVVSFCNPKNEWVRHWHIAENEEEMIAMSLELLTDNNTVYRPVLAYDMNDSAKALMELFR